MYYIRIKKKKADYIPSHVHLSKIALKNPPVFKKSMYGPFESIIETRANAIKMIDCLRRLNPENYILSARAQRSDIYSPAKTLRDVREDFVNYVDQLYEVEIYDGAKLIGYMEYDSSPYRGFHYVFWTVKARRDDGQTEPVQAIYKDGRFGCNFYYTSVI